MENSTQGCLCPSCPSYAECQEHVGYCVLGKSKCIVDEKGCFCGGCPVYQRLKLKGYYFCLER
ncbi:MAG: DUF2769 domain-containing protein [Patescibacteria group bacterium]